MARARPDLGGLRRAAALRARSGARSIWRPAPEPVGEDRRQADALAGRAGGAHGAGQAIGRALRPAGTAGSEGCVPGRMAVDPGGARAFPGRQAGLRRAAPGTVGRGRPGALRGATLEAGSAADRSGTDRPRRHHADPRRPHLHGRDGCGPRAVRAGAHPGRGQFHHRRPEWGRQRPDRPHSRADHGRPARLQGPDPGRAPVEGDRRVPKAQHRALVQDIGAKGVLESSMARWQTKRRTTRPARGGISEETEQWIRS